MDEAGVTLGSAYKALGLSPGANLGEVKAAYRRLALKCHPDVNPKDSGEFRRLSAAYQRILKRAPDEQVSTSYTHARPSDGTNTRHHPPPGYRYEAATTPMGLLKFNRPAALGLGVAFTFLVFGSLVVWCHAQVYHGMRMYEPVRDEDKRKTMAAVLRDYQRNER